MYFLNTSGDGDYHFPEWPVPIPHKSFGEEMFLNIQHNVANISQGRSSFKFRSSFFWKEQQSSSPNESWLDAVKNLYHYQQQSEEAVTILEVKT